MGHYPSHYDYDRDIEGMMPKDLAKLILGHIAMTKSSPVEPETLMIYMEEIADHLQSRDDDIFKKYVRPDQIAYVLKKTGYGTINLDGTVDLTGSGVFTGLLRDFPGVYQDAVDRWVDSFKTEKNE